MTPVSTEPRYVYDVQVFYEDTDAGGVVYHANYLRYFERARSLWLQTLGLTHTRLAQTLDTGFVVSHADVRFRAPACLDDCLQVTVDIARMRRASVVFDQIIQREGDQLVKAQFTVACVKLSRFAPCALPDELRAAAVTAELEGV